MNTTFLEFRLIKAAPGLNWCFEVWSDGELFAHSGVDESFDNPAQAMAEAVKKAKSALHVANQAESAT
jgi:hypothetical protein